MLRISKYKQSEKTIKIQFLCGLIKLDVIEFNVKSVHEVQYLLEVKC